MTDIWLVVGAGAFATFMWRFAGIVIAKHINPDSLLMVRKCAMPMRMVASVMSIILSILSVALPPPRWNTGWAALL